MPLIKLFHWAVDFILWNVVRILFVRVIAYAVVFLCSVGKWEFWILPNLTKRYYNVRERILPLYVWRRRNYFKAIAV
ncbi:hypothetical protein QR680_003172 [Steinernema hermaphroditum]|uniref:Uncharacterized protein n=1 Tax=Steinernema hermaphroditum TaxID=289476 RepID=A0AA39LJ73_9BILA|nr:hypothetical protein QR680_003172 [Steinernema hermaphroditum]